MSECVFFTVSEISLFVTHCAFTCFIIYLTSFPDGGESNSYSLQIPKKIPQGCICWPQLLQTVGPQWAGWPYFHKSSHIQNHPNSEVTGNKSQNIYWRNAFVRCKLAYQKKKGEYSRQSYSFFFCSHYPIDIFLGYLCV